MMNQSEWDTGLIPRTDAERRAEEAERPWLNPGPPPGQRNSQRPSGLVVWIAVALGLLGVGLCTIGVLSAPANEPELGPAGPAVVPQVEASGECQANIVGRYSVLATVTVHNATDIEQRGTVYARWPVTGAEPLVYAEDWVLAPGQIRTMYVDEPVDTERWYRLKACDHGWSATGVPSP
jgi:hypothetical protein